MNHTCPAGQVYNSTTNQCECPKYAPFFDGSKCLACYLPNYWDTFSLKCLTCPSGQFYNLTSKLCVYCPVGYTFNSSTISC